MGQIDAVTIVIILNSILSYFFMFKVMTLKTHKLMDKAYYRFYLFLFILFLTNIFIFTKITWKSDFGETVYLPDIKEDIVIMIIIVIIFRKNIWRSIYFIGYSYMLVQGANILVSLIRNIFMQYIISFMDFGDHFTLTNFLLPCFLVLFYLLIKSKHGKEYVIDDKEWKSFSLLAFIVCLYFYYINDIVPYVDPENNIMYITIRYIQLGFMVSVYVLFSKYSKLLSKKNKDLLGTKLKLQSEEFQMRLRDELTQANNENKKLRHDLKNHFSVLQDKIETDPEYALKYVKELSERVTVVRYADTSNVILNHILDQKSAIALQKNIVFTYQIQDSLSFVEDFDLITLLGNLLDNAMDAQAYVEDKWIHMSIHHRERMVMIVVENNCNPALLKFEKEAYRSTKEDNGKHGFGIRNVRDCCIKYKGGLNTTQSGNEFHAVVLLPVDTV